MMSIIITFFLGWFGFYLVKGPVSRDRETGVGQIMATTPMSRPAYMLGKWISNFAVLMAMVVILMIAGLIIQLLSGESRQIDLAVYIAPFLYIVMPLMAPVAAVAVLFEVFPFLSGGFGNIVYFFGFVMVIPLTMEITQAVPAIEPLGIALLKADMSAEILRVFPDYDGSFMLGGLDTAIEGTFTWTGIDWMAPVIATRFGYIGLAVLVTLAGSLCFDRFDLSRRKPRRMKSNGSVAVPVIVTVSEPLPVVHLTPLQRTANRFHFFHVLLAEWRLVLKGQYWWWYLGAAGLIIASVVNPVGITRQYILPLAWIWPILLISPIGNREARHNMQQIAFSSAAPLWRQLPAQWPAGFITALIMGSGAALKYAAAGDSDRSTMSPAGISHPVVTRPDRLRLFRKGKTTAKLIHLRVKERGAVRSL